MALLALAGCAVGPDYVKPAEQVPDLWRMELTRGLAEGEANFQQWWGELEDPMLVSLIQRAEDTSLDIRLALERIDEAAGRRGIARGEWFPSVDSVTQYSRNRTSENILPDEVLPFGRTDDFYDVSIAGSWEVDLFGRIRRNVESNTAALDSSIENFRDVLVVLYAEIGITYVDARTFQERIRFNEANIEAQRGTLELVIERNRAGLVGDLDVRQAEENLGRTEALLPFLRQRYVQSVNRLGVLLGLYPSALHEELARRTPIPEPPSEVLIGVPRDSLRQRPDIRRAERDLAAATARIGVATADLFPRLTILGTFGFQATDAVDWTNWSSRAFSIGPKVVWNIFDGGKIRSNIRTQEALTAQALTRYERTVLDALEDAESSMIAFVEEQNRRDALQRSATASAQAVELVKTLYRTGLTDFQNVLDTERSLFERQDELAQSRGLVAQNLIRVYRSLGGGWTPAAPPPTP
ncbi:MAG: efflux transporter outer membrane subunit [Myxococcota bacterium]|nr:efflux transporter outer membrane subunit [Myxococcota bacterium]